MPFEAYHALVMELAALKREGFVPSSPAGEAASAPELAIEIEAAILGLAVEPQTERQLRKTAWELRRAGLSDSEIAAKITAGEEVEL